jgi:hypothetical protein
LQQAAEDQGAAIGQEVEVAVVLVDAATDHLRLELDRGAAHGEEETWDRVEGEERGELNDWSLARRGLDRAVGMRSQGEATRGLKGYRCVVAEEKERGDAARFLEQLGSL